MFVARAPAKLQPVTQRCLHSALSIVDIIRVVIETTAGSTRYATALAHFAAVVHPYRQQLGADHLTIKNNTVTVFVKIRYNWSLWCQRQVHFKTKYKSHARSPAIGQRRIVPVFGLKRPGTPGFVYVV